MSNNVSRIINNNHNSSITRKSFLCSAATGGGLIAGAALTNSAKVVLGSEATTDETYVEPLWTAELPESWDLECEMLVIGCGIGGSCAVLEANELGMDVIGVEKNSTITACNCARSGGWLCATGCSLQKRDGIEDSIDQWVKDIMADGGDMADEDVVRAWGEISGETVDWLIDLGCPVQLKTLDTKEMVGSEAHSVPRAYRTEPYGNGIGWMQGLEAALEDHGINMMYETAGEKIYRNKDGRVVGARVVDNNDNPINIKATKGVLISTGGMGDNMDMWVRYCPMLREVRDNADDIFFVGPYTCTGDGITMLEGVGAMLWPTKSVIGNGPVTDPEWKVEKLRTSTHPHIWQNSPIMVNKNGERFYNETSFHEYMTDRPFKKQPGMCSILIFDEAARLSQDGQDYAQWSIDAAPILGREDLVGSSDTIEGLAEYFGMDPEKLKASVDDYNAHVDSQEPDEFGREKFLVKYEQPPFWGIKHGIVMGTSKGGAKINDKGQAYDYHDNIIPGLYVAGEDAMFSGHGDAREHIVGGCNSMAACYGRIAARNILNETPWE